MLLTLINDLLDLAKFETMNFKFNEDYFNLNELISKAYNTMKYQAAQKNINIIRDYQIKISNPESKYYGIDMSFEEFVKAKVDFQVFRLSESTISENLR